jgi:outer membrane protein OmpA-like peptidoglycan-associated protein
MCVFATRRYGEKALILGNVITELTRLRSIMPIPRFSTCFAVLVVCFIAGFSQAHADSCDALIAQFNKSVDAGQDAEAEKLAAQISTEALCGKYQILVQHRLSVLRLSVAQDIMARGRPVEEYERILSLAARPGVLWQAAATLAEVRFGERRFVEAAMGFDNAIEIIKNPNATATVPSTFEIQGLVERASQARILAANASSAHDAPAFVPTASGQRDGKLGGIYSSSVRGIVPHSVALSITFDYRQATLTEVGADAARELVRAIEEQQPDKVIVIGHTDPRGGSEYNLKLSEDRAKAVANFLRENGVKIPIETSGVGSSEPLKIDDTGGLTQDDIYALNRRVEWQRSSEAMP